MKRRVGRGKREERGFVRLALVDLLVGKYDMKDGLSEVVDKLFEGER